MTAHIPTIRHRRFGYARVSTDDQDLSLQLDALIRFGVNQADIYRDRMSGAKEDRPGLAKYLTTLRPGDTLVVWRLDRLGRSMRHLVTLVEDLRENNFGFKSISDGAIDTTSASGELIFRIFSALAQFERRLIQERTRAGLAAARARGRVGGRKPLDPETPRIVLAKKLHRDKSIGIQQICQTLHISKTTLYRYLKTPDPSDGPETTG
ncbi:MAG: recombinase family protein [Planctomycetaceae bacterium]|nr:recombinase family protein [Planctomycetaceae bacterium]